ncbi:ribosomal subunit interface protein [Candidatus Parcubacteria bacterium]|nr:MAG: ribosomal subunit interface protein [Candidatus Parcubacteria bacterium]
MQVKIKATKIELNDKIKDYVQEKMDMLEKYLGSVTATNCDFEVAQELGGQNKGKIYRAELNLSVPGELLRVEKQEADLFKAIDKVKDHMARSIKRYKEKRMDKKRKG